MKEQGVISKIISDRLAEVAFEQTAACGRCGVCHEAGNGIVAIEAVNDVNAKVGDRVEVDFSTAEVIGTSAIVFILPIVLLVLGFVLGNHFSEVIGVVLGMSFLLASFLLIILYDRIIQKKHACTAQIVRVI